MRTVVLRVIRRTAIGFLLVALAYVVAMTALLIVFDPMRGWGS